MTGTLEFTVGGSPLAGDNAMELLAAVLYSTGLRPDERLTGGVVRRTVCRHLGVGRSEGSAYLRIAASEAARHPALCADRMNWCRRTVAQAFGNVQVPPPRW